MSDKAAVPEVKAEAAAAEPASAKRKAEDDVEEPAAKKADVDTTLPDAPANSKQIVKQIEFYFGNSNLMRPDKHLVAKISENADGWVELAHLASFVRMKQMVPDSDVKVIAAALRTSTNDLVEVSEDNQSVRRSATCPLPEKYDYHKNCIYTKGWDLKETTIDTINEFFAKATPPSVVTSVRLRHTPQTKEFKGSAFVELPTVEAAQKCTENKYELPSGETLLVEMKESYLQRKKAERQERKKGEKAAKAAEKAANGGVAKEEDTKIEIKEGCVLHISGLEGAVSFSDIKDAFNKYASVRYVDLKRGETAGHVRFADADAAAAKGKFDENKDTIKDATPVLRVIEGEEEKTYWDKFNADMNASRKREADGEPDEDEEVEVKDGFVIHYSGLPDDTSREDIKEVLNKYSEVQWVDFQRGDTEGHARFGAADAQKVKDEVEAAKDTIKDSAPVLRVLEGDENVKYWEKVAQGKKDRKSVV